MSSNQPESKVADEAAAPEPGNVLRILSGLHAGATRDLAEQEMILVGSGDDCDIVLADQGVARHHALINLVGGMSSLRALDAPLRVDGLPLLPGDPVELRGLQRIELGEAAIAFGQEHDPGWASLLPDAAALANAARPQPAGVRKLPLIAALAVLSLASLAIFAAVMPQHEKPVDPRSRLQAMISEFHVVDGQVAEDAEGRPILRGTVRDASVRESIEERIAKGGFEAAIDLRSGDKIAADVSEVLRTQGINAKTRYLGNGVVEASGRFEDMDAMREAARSRAMDDVPGVTKVLVKNFVPADQLKRSDGPTEAAARNAPTRIVSVVRGEEPHLVAVDGTEYPVGSEVPGHGRLVSIGQSAHVVSADGTLHKVVPRPVTAAEIEAAAEKKAAADAAAAGFADMQDDAAAEPRRVARTGGAKQDTRQKQ